MKTKEQIIQEAYGEYWDQVKNYVDENGYCNKIDLFQNKRIRYEEINLQLTHHTDFTMSPKSLQGIENNNGWIRILSNEDLPKEKSFFNACYFNRKNDPVIFYGISLYELIGGFEDKNITHYQPIQKPNPPIY